MSPCQVTTNVITTVDNVLDVSNDVYVKTLADEAPTDILNALEAQTTLYQTQGHGGNLTVIGDNIGVVALKIPDASLDEGLGFASLSSGEEDGLQTKVYFDTDEIPRSTVDASLVLPSSVFEFIPSFSNGESKVFHCLS